ncbi:MAG: hypothetical protein JSW71_12770 [Gemmatimonadota bacterium]|nr:MAG: hypothetical protein JSW71_12770 [Gemmatimonadota bacterium]
MPFRSFDLAKKEAADRLEGEAISRAFEGVDEPVGWLTQLAVGRGFVLADPRTTLQATFSPSLI